MGKASLAIIPKARGMYAKRPQPAEYEELMRRRTVPEVASALKKYPYFGDSLATLSAAEPRREQLEELLNMDIFNKYEALLKYDFSDDSFARYFLAECEVKEIARVLRMLSTGVSGRYIQHMPPFLEGNLRFDLFRLAEARSFADVLEVLRFTPYDKVLRPIWIKDPFLRNYPGAEAALVRFYYDEVFAMADKYLPKQDQKAVKSLFLQEVENFNLGLVLRSKMYFGAAFTPDKIRALLVPYYYRISKRKLQDLIEAPNPEGMVASLIPPKNRRLSGPVTPEEYETIGGQELYSLAKSVLHLSVSPSAVLAAFMFLARLERDNVVNIIEGVRYQMAPEKIKALLWF